MFKESQFCRSGRCSPGTVAHVTGPELDEELKDPSSPILLDVFATWCGPCRMMAPTLDTVAKKMQKRIRIMKMDSDKDPQKSGQLGVRSLPTLILFNKQGVEVKRQLGMMQEEQLMSFLTSNGV